MRLLLAPILAATVLLAGCSITTEEPSKPKVAAETPGTPAGWKVESYGDVTLTVPDSWAPGYSPMRDRGVRFRPIWCRDAQAGPYVGRPQHGSDLCNGDPLPQVRELGFDQEAVWFESPLPVGRIGKGVVADTVTVGSSRVTVAARSADVRDQIIASARVIAGTDPNGCPLAPVAPDADRVAEGPGRVRSFAVCAYDEDGSLLWSGTRSPADGDALVKAVRDAPTASGLLPERSDAHVVNLVLGTKKLIVHWRIAPDVGVLRGNGMTVQLTPGLTRLWAGDGIRAYVGGGGRGLAKFYRPIMG